MARLGPKAKAPIPPEVEQTEYNYSSCSFEL